MANVAGVEVKKSLVEINEDEVRGHLDEVVRQPPIACATAEMISNSPNKFCRLHRPLKELKLSSVR